MGLACLRWAALSAERFDLTRFYRAPSFSPAARPVFCGAPVRDAAVVNPCFTSGGGDVMVREILGRGSLISR